MIAGLAIALWWLAVLALLVLSHPELYWDEP